LQSYLRAKEKEENFKSICKRDKLNNMTTELIKQIKNLIQQKENLKDREKTVTKDQKLSCFIKRKENQAIISEVNLLRIENKQ
jgi:hypothetical protein